MDDVVVDACCMINLYAAGDLRNRLSLLGCRWYVPTVVVAEALYVHVKQADGAVEKVPIDLQLLVDDGTLLSCTTESAGELELYVDLATRIDDGEAMALAIAKSRGWTLSTDDRKARRIADGLSVSVLTTPDLIKRWADSAIVSCDELRDTLRLIEDRASFFPAVSHPLHAWWRENADGE
jgi:predicted nucleic acid-binding protein